MILILINNFLYITILKIIKIKKININLKDQF